MPEERQERFDAFISLTKSEEWYAFVDFLKEHKRFLQEKLNQYVRNKENDEASVTLALMDECSYLVETFIEHGNKLKKE